jgi:DnaK suppressor protein
MSALPIATDVDPSGTRTSPYLSSAALDRLRQLLADERQELHEARDECERMLFDDAAPESSEATSREELEIILIRHNASLDAVDKALALMDSGSYGWCTGCGSMIALGRLEAMPSATTCVGCHGYATDGSRLLGRHLS